MSEGKPVIFVGPSLDWQEVAERFDAHICPPAAQGDLLSAALNFKPSIIGLIDGLFGAQPAVRHREIQAALSLGTPVHGAASMGALRAAELHDQGMVGHGLITRWYRLTSGASDDAVAVAHMPAELGAGPLSTSLIDLRLAFKAARRRGLVTRETELHLSEVATTLPYADRGLPAVLDRAKADINTLPPKREFDAVMVHQKRDDAWAMVDWIAENPAPPPPTKDAQFSMTGAFWMDLKDAGFSLDDIQCLC
ncbi:MAG: TfuA-like protein [Pseudomonadota bacterium]